MGQECGRCRVNIYPRRQRPLQKGDRAHEADKPHLQHLCEMCKRKGSSCQLGD
jgi:hypothetical protein